MIRIRLIAPGTEVEALRLREVMRGANYLQVYASTSVGIDTARFLKGQGVPRTRAMAALDLLSTEARTLGQCDEVARAAIEDQAQNFYTALETNPDEDHVLVVAHPLLVVALARVIAGHLDEKFDWLGCELGPCQGFIITFDSLDPSRIEAVG